MGVGDLTIENRTDRVEIYGSLTITRDKVGLALALALKELTDAALEVLKNEELPERIADKPATKVANPFATKK